MSTKKNRIYFIKEVEKIILENKGELVKEDEHKKEFKIPMSDNDLHITLYEESDHKTLYSVFMCFDKPRTDLGNRYSGKHNFHQSEGGMVDTIEVVDRFEEFLLNALK